MDYEQMNNNSISIRGIIVRDKELSHEFYGEKFYEYLVSVERLSGSYDIIPVIISEKIITDNLKVGNEVSIVGQFRSYNKIEEDRSHLMLSVFARDIVEPDYSQNSNQITLRGFVCKTPIYRMTPFKREICDIMLAVNRAYGKSDYIPVITWGRNAKYCSNFKVGEKIEVKGRIQSREYQKKLPDGTIENRVAYEVSVISVSKMSETDIGNGTREDAISDSIDA